MRQKVLIATLSLGILFITVIGIFWYQEWKYLLPTPVPQAYQTILAGQKVEIFDFEEVSPKKPLFLHFFNPDCPCSKFNFEHFRQLVGKYKTKINFCVVLQTDETQEEAVNHFHQRYGLDVPILLDKHQSLANACGVYSTPQAVLLNNEHSLYFRGNYNRSRYCADPGSNFAQMAIDSLLANRVYPRFPTLATKAYGCQLPDKKLFNIF